MCVRAHVCACVCVYYACLHDCLSVFFNVGLSSTGVSLDCIGEGSASLNTRLLFLRAPSQLITLLAASFNCGLPPAEAPSRTMIPRVISAKDWVVVVLVVVLVAVLAVVAVFVVVQDFRRWILMYGFDADRDVRVWLRWLLLGSGVAEPVVGVP